MKGKQIMTTIQASNFISSGFSKEEADLLQDAINTAVSAKKPFVIDFNDVNFFTTLFFSAALTRLIGEIGHEEYDRLITVENLSESGTETYNHALEYAIEYYAKPNDEREKERQIINEEMENL